MTDETAPRVADPAFYWARVTHARHTPFRHRFAYRVFMLLLDIDRMAETSSRTRLLAYNRWSPLSVHDSDHGPRDGAPLRPWVEDALAKAGVDIDGGPIRLLAMPRVLGYAFNPIAIYFCFGRDGRLRAALYEVRNTFGGAHAYVCIADPNAALQRHSADKRFYVSPFIGMEARYDFALRVPGDTLAFAIEETTPDGRLLSATLMGKRAPLNDQTLLASLVSLPLMTLKVMAAIHWQALKLWWKGARFHRETTQTPAPIATSRTHAHH